MINKTTFIADKDRIDYAEFMSNEELWMLFRKILQHENWLEEIDLPLEFKFTREKIRKVLDENTEKWINKVGSISEKRSEAWKKHKWNQYTKMEQMEQNGTNGTNNGVSEIWTDKLEQMEQNGTLSDNTNNISFLDTTSSKKEERNKKKEEMILAVKNHPKLSNIIREEDLDMWLDYKIDKKQPYKNARSFCTYLVSTLKTVSYWRVQLDLSKRFSYAVDIAIAQWWDWIHWYDWMESDYQKSKKDLFPNPEEDE